MPNFQRTKNKVLAKKAKKYNQLITNQKVQEASTKPKNKTGD
jgi:hypothetical protein